MNKLKLYNIVEILSWIFSRPNKDIDSRYMAEHLLNEISIEKGIDFDLFVENFNEFQINVEYDANNRLNC